MARGYSQARSENLDAGYRLKTFGENEKQGRVEKLDRLVEGKYITAKAAEVLKEDGSQHDGRYYNESSLKRTFGKDFFKKGWVQEKSDFIPNAVIEWKNLGGQIFYKVKDIEMFGGVPYQKDGKYVGMTYLMSLDEKVLAENGGRYKTIKEAIDVLETNSQISQKQSGDAMQSAYEAAGSPRGWWE